MTITEIIISVSGLIQQVLTTVLTNVHWLWKCTGKFILGFYPSYLVNVSVAWRHSNYIDSSHHCKPIYCCSCSKLHFFPVQIYPRDEYGELWKIIVYKYAKRPFLVFSFSDFLCASFSQVSPPQEQGVLWKEWRDGRGKGIK